MSTLDISGRAVGTIMSAYINGLVEKERLLALAENLADVATTASSE